MSRFNKAFLIRMIDRFGSETQINKIQEEALELSLALNQINCPTKDKAAMTDQLYGELADMKIMMAQAELLFDSEIINRIVEEKLDRFEKKFLTNP